MGMTNLRHCQPSGQRIVRRGQHGPGQDVLLGYDAAGHVIWSGR
jgi:hypothetical protein